MNQRLLVMAVALVLMISASGFSQEKKGSPASPSDISVDEIKKAVQKKKAAAEPAAEQKAEQGKAAASEKNAPQPVVEGTEVAQPDCQGDQESACNNGCQGGLGGRLVTRLRELFGRCCCQ